MSKIKKCHWFVFEKWPSRNINAISAFEMKCVRFDVIADEKQNTKAVYGEELKIDNKYRMVDCIKKEKLLLEMRRSIHTDKMYNRWKIQKSKRLTCFIWEGISELKESDIANNKI